MHTQLCFPFTTPGAVDFDDLALREDFDAVLKELDQKFQPIIDALQESERLSAEDFELRMTNFD